jgi:hypothetical protein
MTHDGRLERQVQLVEIGAAGQARISAHTAAVPSEASGLVGLVARRYAERAGFADVVEGPAEEAPDFVEAPAARAVVAGSLAALREIRAAVFGDTP